MKTYVLKKTILICIFLATIMCGAIFEKLGYFSYINPFIKSFLFTLKSLAVKEAKKSNEFIFTNNLTFEWSEINLPSIDKYGGLASAFKYLLYVDIDGRLIFLNQKEILFTKYTPLPNNKEKFIKYISKYPDGLLKVGQFGVRSVLVVPRSGDKSKIDLYVLSNNFNNNECFFLSLFKNTLVYENNGQVDLENNNWQEIYKTTPCLPKIPNHGFAGTSAGGKLAIDNKGSIYIATADFLFDGVNARPILGYKGESNSDYGKLIVLSSDKSSLISIKARGLRNPQGLFITESGIFETEHGPKGGDELNFIHHYENNLDFGWPYATFGTDYNSETWPLDLENKNGFKTMYRLPLFFWIPDIGISSILEIKAHQKNDSLKLWNKNLLIGSLSSHSLYRLILDNKKNQVIGIEKINLSFGVRDMLQIGDIIYLLKDSREPSVVIIKTRND